MSPPRADQRLELTQADLRRLIGALEQRPREPGWAERLRQSVVAWVGAIALVLGFLSTVVVGVAKLVDIARAVEAIPEIASNAERALEIVEENQGVIEDNQAAAQRREERIIAIQRQLEEHLSNH